MGRATLFSGQFPLRMIRGTLDFFELEGIRNRNEIRARFNGSA